MVPFSLFYPRIFWLFTWREAECRWWCSEEHHCANPSINLLSFRPPHIFKSSDPFLSESLPLPFSLSPFNHLPRTRKAFVPPRRPQVATANELPGKLCLASLLWTWTRLLWTRAVDVALRHWLSACMNCHLTTRIKTLKKLNTNKSEAKKHIPYDNAWDLPPRTWNRLGFMACSLHFSYPKKKMGKVSRQVVGMFERTTQGWGDEDEDGNAGNP